jgi:putative phosphoesterase
MKQFQDVLGDMHDYYVWMQELRADRSGIPAEARHGVTKLLRDLMEMTKTRYRNFVFLWDDAIANGLFDRIRRLIDVGPRSVILQEILQRDKRIAVISDIHGNLDALRAVVSDAQKSGLQVFLNAGDAVGFGIYPSQVVQTLRSAIFLNVVGNVDLEVLEALHNPGSKGDEAGKNVAIDELTPADVAYLQSLPKELRLQTDGKTILVTHGTPESVDEHLYPDSPEERLREIAIKASADVIITGHTHMPMKRDVDGVIFMNPGSVGRPVDGDPCAEYAVLSFDPFSLEFRKVNYDFETVADEMRKKGLPENLAQVLLRAVPSSAIKKQEEELKRNATWKNRSTIRKVRSIANKYTSDEAHAEQDRKLALTIFDKTKNLHNLGDEERYWLECAALLHDIGLSKSERAHHKSSLNIILNEPKLPFTHKERYLIGSIARYHRKALPDKKHFNLKPLNQTEKEKVAILSSILRIADALDYSHKSVVSRVNVKTFPNHIALECRFSGNHDLEDMSVSRKKDLFEKMFKSALTIVWKPNLVTRSIAS